MPDWLILSDREAPKRADPEPLAQGMFVLEFRLPLDCPSVLVDTGTPSGRDDGTLSVFFDPVAGPTVLLRQAGRVRRHMLHGDLPATLSGIARLTLWLDGAGERWRMRLDLLDSGVSLESRGADPVAFDLTALQRLADPMRGALRHPAVLWFGLTPEASLPHAAPWIGQRTPIDTDQGQIAAGHLRPGQLIRTLDAGFVPLRSIQRMTLPAAGSFAPVILRRPFFGAGHDILVSNDQLVLISGASVEYLTGEEEALIPAGALADGKVAVRDSRRATTDCLALDLGRAAIIVADGCCLLSMPLDQPAARLPRRALADWEMPPLLNLLGRTSLRHVA